MARKKKFSKPTPPVKGIDTPFYPAELRNTNEKTERIANSEEALFGRLTYGAGPNFTRYSSYPATELNPAKIYSILREADLGWMLRWAEMCEQVLERDAHLRGINYARTVEVSGKPFLLQARNETEVAKSVAKFVHACLDEIESFEQCVEDLLLANAYGFSCSEIVWAQDRVRFPGANGSAITIECLVPRRLEYVHQKHFRFSQLKDEPLLVLGRDGEIGLPPNKFIFHSATGTGLVERRGFMRPCIWLHACKQWATRDWLVYANLFGLPQIEGVYDNAISLQAVHRTQYEQALQDFGKGIPFLHPDDLQIKITPPPNLGKSSDVHGALIGWANAEMSKTVQGETLTTELGGVGSYNASETHADVKHAIVRADARKLAATLKTELLASIVMLNIEKLMSATGASADEIKNCIPSIVWRIDRETTPEARMRIISMAVNELGLPVDQEQTRREFGLDAPQPGSEPLPGSPTPVTGGGAVLGSLEASVEGKEIKKEDQNSGAQ